MMNYRNSKISLITTGSATLTVKIQVSYQEKVPDFTSASSPTNHWVYGGSYDIDPWTFIAGSTGVSASGTDINKILVVNENNPRWINLEVSGYSAGTVYAFITANNNI